MIKNTIFNVVDFGAVPNSEFLCTESFQKALDAAGECHGTVEIPSGRWPLGELHVPAGITISGTYTWNWSSWDGFHGTILSLSDDKVKCMLDMTHAHGTHLSGLSMDGRHLGQGIHGVFIDRNAYDKTEDSLKIDGCRIGYFSGDSVRLQFVRGFAVHHSMLCFSDGWGIYVTGENGQLYDNWFSSSATGNAALGAMANSIRFWCNRFEDTPTGVDINLFLPMGNEAMEGCHDIVFHSNCMCGGAYGGVLAVGTEECTLKNIIFMGNAFNVNGGADAVDLEDRSSHILASHWENSVISGNTFFAGRGFFEPTKRVLPSFAIVYDHMKNCTIAENGINMGSLYPPLQNRGFNENLILHNNQGREVPQIDDYLFPWFTMRQFPEGRMGQDEKARQRNI